MKNITKLEASEMSQRGKELTTVQDDELKLMGKS